VSHTGICLEGVSFGYTRERLFDDLELSLEPGNIYGLLGKNGAGKTSLLKLVCGLRLPQQGRCEVLGFAPQSRPAELLEDIYFLPEEFYTPPVTAELYERIYSPFYPRFNHDDFEQYRQEFEIDDKKRLSELSYGQKKKFLLAFGLASGCRLLLLDEPTNGLDIPSKSQFRKLLARAGEEHRIILISTHQVRDMENLIDPIIILDQGRIIFNQPLYEVSRRLQMELEPEQPPADAALYSDKTLGGWVVVRPNSSGDETRVDLETLFNAVVGNPERVAALFAPAAGAATEEV
jgi:ABC-2 type transport system ATP-binding protein